MKWVLLAVIVGASNVRVALRIRRRAHRRAGLDGDGRPGAPHRLAARLPDGPIALVARREVRERTRSRMFRVGTLIVVAGVAAAVTIPALTKGSRTHLRVGVVGALSPSLRATVEVSGVTAGATVVLVDEPSEAAAERELRSGSLALVVVDGTRLVVDQPLTAGSSGATAELARTAAAELSLQGGLERAGIAPGQALRLAHPAPLPVVSLQRPRTNGTTRATAVYGLILLFVLLTQYGTWTLMGVVEEKSSRVVEVLLATVRPVQLLGGKVLGIGLVALAQAALLLAVALGLGAAVGSSLVSGTAPTELAVILLWLLLGYAFYSWVWAAGGSLAERQEHVQALAFPLQLPLLLGYIVSLTSLGSSEPSTFVRILAYLPPTAPFAMSVLVADDAAGWWQVAISAVVSVAATVGIAFLAAGIYRRPILRTGRRVRLREVLSG